MSAENEKTHAGEEAAGMPIMAEEEKTQASGEESPITEALADETFAEWMDAVDAELGQGFTENPPQVPDDNEIPAAGEAEDLTMQLAEARDQLLRKSADFENFRKRMNQEKQSAIEFANQTLLMDIIPIIDDFERAIQSAETSVELCQLPAGKAMIEGITMIEKRLVSQLENKWGLKRIDSAGKPFDPNFHEAMLMDKSPDVEEAIVQEEFAKGYTLKDRVVRAAKVKVIMPEDRE